MTKTQENIETALPGMSRNTISGSIWDLDQTHQDKVYKVSKGIFRLLKYQSSGAPAQTPTPHAASAAGSGWRTSTSPSPIGS